MNKKSIAKNYIYNVLYEVLAIIIPLVTTPYLSRVLGAERIGVYSYTLSIATYFILFGSLGTATYGKREIAFVQDDKEKRSKAFSEIFFLRLVALSISLILFYFTFCSHGNYEIYYKILLLEIIANILDVSWFFQGLEEFKKTVIRNIIIKVISAVCIFIFVRTPDDLWKYFLIYALSTLVGNMSLWLYLPKYVIKQKLNELCIKKHLKPTILLFVPQIATQIYTVLDKTMIGAIIVDKSEVGLYEQSQKIIKILLTLATSLGTVMMPRIAFSYAKGEVSKIKRYMEKSFSFITMLAFPMMTGIISISCHFVPIFYGDGFEKVKTLLCVISPIIIFIGLSNVIGTQYLLPTKQQKKYTLSVVCGAIVNFGLNLLLIPKYASVGASIATVFAELAVTTVQFWLVRKQISFTSTLKIIAPYFLASILMFIPSLIIGSCIENHTLSLAIQGTASVIIYVATLYIFHDPNLLLITNKVKHSLAKPHK